MASLNTVLNSSDDTPVDVASSGDNTIVAAVPGYRIMPVGGLLISKATVDVRWKSGAATSKSGPIPLAANTGFLMPFPIGFKTKSGEALVLNLSVAVQVSGWINFILVPA